MDLRLSEEQLMIKIAARDFARKECLPGVTERDEDMQFPCKQYLFLMQTYHYEKDYTNIYHHS